MRTGAVARRIGKFEQAHGGTMFLDEIGDMSLATQAKVLRLLQDRSFQRLGGNETIRVDVRACATSRNLEKGIAEGTFREDLYHRLNVVTIQLPPLRQRRDDIAGLTDYFLIRSARRLGVEKPPLAEDAVDLLVNYAWPGNVRELEHLIEQLVIFTGGYTIQAADLPAVVRTGVREASESAPSADDQWLTLIRAYLAAYGGSAAHEDLLDKIETLLISEALRLSHGNQTQAARLLGLSRPTLHAKMRKHGLRAGDDAPQASPSCSERPLRRSVLAANALVAFRTGRTPAFGPANAAHAFPTELRLAVSLYGSRLFACIIGHRCMSNSFH